MSTGPPSPDEKEKGTGGIGWTVRHDIGIHRVQRDGFMQVDHAFHTAFRPDALGVVTPPTHRHTAAAISNVIQMEREDFARPQAAIEHQPHQSEVAGATQGVEESLDLIGLQGPRQAVNRSDPHPATDGMLATDPIEKGPMPLRDARGHGIRDFLQRIGVRIPTGNDSELIKR
jgi:hypothetical protein